MKNIITSMALILFMAGCKRWDSGQSLAIGRTSVALISICDAISTHYVEKKTLPIAQDDFEQILVGGENPYFRPGALQDGWGNSFVYIRDKYSISIASGGADKTKEDDIRCNLNIDSTEELIFRTCYGLHGRPIQYSALSFHEYDKDRPQEH